MTAANRHIGAIAAIALASLFPPTSYAFDEAPVTVQVPPSESWRDGSSRGGFVIDGAWSAVNALGGDFATQATYPFRLARDEPWTFFIGTAGVAALIASDGITRDVLAPASIRNGSGFQSSMQSYSNVVSTRNAVALVAGFGAVGLFADSQRERDTSLMLLESVLTSAVWTEALKNLTRRERPREIEGNDSDWAGPGHVFADDPVSGGLLSFPSGHASGTWAMATVLAHQYPEHGIVPAAAYTAATAMSYSRIVVSAHWLSDVALGALIGYGCARQVMSAQRDRRAASDAAGWQLNMDVTKQHVGMSVSYEF